MSLSFVVILVVVFTSIPVTKASRPLEDSKLVEEPLQHTPVPPEGGSPCTFIPTPGHGDCPPSAQKKLSTAEPLTVSVTHHKGMVYNTV